MLRLNSLFRMTVLPAAAGALLMFAGGTAPAPAADLDCDNTVKLTCSGFEPNWQFTLPGNGTVEFVDPENPNAAVTPLVVKACVNPIGKDAYRILAGAPLQLEATVTPQSCTEPNDAVKPLTISISFRQGAQGQSPTQVSGPGCCSR